MSNERTGWCLTQAYLDRTQPGPAYSIHGGLIRVLTAMGLSGKINILRGQFVYRISFFNPNTSWTVILD